MSNIRRDENKRESWWITNKTTFNMAVGDLLLLPVIKPGKRIDILRYYSREKISHSTVLASLLKQGKFSLNKEKLFSNNFPGKINIEDIDEAITPAEENEVGETNSESECEQVFTGQPITEETKGVILYGKDINNTAQPIGIAGEESNKVQTIDLDIELLLEDIYLELIKANIQMSIITGNNFHNKDIDSILKN
ncbi:MAG: hypothetical protein KAH05_04585 [Clostridiales bacterium]|nr:hypothetical protein [Clostridiales bacterium]